jgi:hypothetical protein
MLRWQARRLQHPLLRVCIQEMAVASDETVADSRYVTGFGRGTFRLPEFSVYTAEYDVGPRKPVLASRDV